MKNNCILHCFLISFMYCVHSADNQQHKGLQFFNTETKKYRCEWDEIVYVWKGDKNIGVWNTHGLWFYWQIMRLLYRIRRLAYRVSCQIQYVVKFMWAWYDEYNFFMYFVGAAPNLSELVVFKHEIIQTQFLMQSDDSSELNQSGVQSFKWYVCITFLHVFVLFFFIPMPFWILRALTWVYFF